jgi:hypothetical protein
MGQFIFRGASYVLYTYRLCGRIPQIYHHNANIGYEALSGILANKARQARVVERQRGRLRLRVRTYPEAKRQLGSVLARRHCNPRTILSCSKPDEYL